MKPKFATHRPARAMDLNHKHQGPSSAARMGLLAGDMRTWLFLAILAIAVFARTWEYGSLPPPLYPDEYVVSVDAYSILHFGVDHNLVSYPVFLTAWGEGTSVLYAYLVMPFLSVGGLSPLTFRLPMLISALLTLPLIYLIARHYGGARLGLIATFLLAISPWHIMLSRWALECNILPWIFSLAFLMMLTSLGDSRWFVPAMVFFGLSLYAYATALASIPLFLILAVPCVLAARSIQRSHLLAGLVAFALIAAPLAGFVVVNSFHLQSIHVGPLTIPRLPAIPRYETVLSPLSSEFLSTLWLNMRIMVRLLITELDSHLFNTVSPYGYLYRYTFPLAVGGAVILTLAARLPGRRIKWMLLMAWLAASLSLGLLQDVNVNRINLIFVPLILCVAVALDWIADHQKTVAYSLLTALLVGFVLFTRDYHGTAYRTASARQFWDGALAAVDFASRQGDRAICITDEFNYAVVLFDMATRAQYQPQELRFDRPHAQVRKVPRLYPYTFGLQKCLREPGTIYILSDEEPPERAADFNISRFGLFTVYVPR